MMYQRKGGAIVTKKCKQCGAELKDDTLFCTECGAKQDPVIICPKCGIINPEKNEFCTECGAKLRTFQTPRSEAISGGNNMSSNPNTYHPTGKSEPKNSSRNNIFYIVGISILIVTGIIFIVPHFYSTTPSPSHSTSNSINVKAEEMLDAYIRDQSKADTKYKNKTVQITGQLIEKGQFNNSQDYLLNIGSKIVGGKTYSILIDIDLKHADAINSVHIGDYITAQGQCVGTVDQKQPTDITVEIRAAKVNDKQVE